MSCQYPTWSLTPCSSICQMPPGQLLQMRQSQRRLSQQPHLLQQAQQLTVPHGRHLRAVSPDLQHLSCHQPARSWRRLLLARKALLLLRLLLRVSVL